MCGIAGIIRTDGRPVEPSVLDRMAARLEHRGPDQCGTWIDPARPTAGLAVRRLIVIDPAGSRQPLASEAGTVHVAHNGEIYNFADLRTELAARGHVFRTAGDTEVLAHLYKDAGPDLLGRLVGMFAFAIWDAPRRRLMLARDRLGQKPLYWWHGPVGLAFASEPAALVECPDVPRDVDRPALANYLRFGYVPAPATGFAAVRKLPPAHYLLFDADTGRLTGPIRWWDVPRGPVPAADPAALRNELRTTLAAAVRSQLVADVPLGVLLSGGIDSSVVAALAARESPGRLRTFTVSFAESGWDESPYARGVAARLGTEHTEVRVEPRCIEAAEDLALRHGEPFADSSGIAMYYLSREVRRSVTVALSGDGGDESFGGYPRHAALMLSERMPAALRRVLAAYGRRMSPAADRRSRWNAARRFFVALDKDPLPRYLAWRQLFSTEDLAALLAPPQTTVIPSEALQGRVEESRRGRSNILTARFLDSLRSLGMTDPEAFGISEDAPPAAWLAAIAGLESRPWVDRAMAIDLVDYLPDDCLAKVDIASMRHSLEVRSPMLDHRVVELARRIPVELKWRRRFGRPPLGKAILRDMMAGVLPPHVLARGKRGFGVPVGRWLAGPHAGWMRGILLDPSTLARGLFNRAALEGMITAHTSRRADHGDRLWALIMLELWFRAFKL
jgi:asparagine synthase (glutamine-hydrolysing)